MMEKETEMEILGKFLGVEIASRKNEIHSSFAQLVDMSRDEINRRDVDDQLFLLVDDIMHKVFSELDNSDAIKWDILYEIFRYLMSLMSESRTNQDRVRSNGHFISFIHENFYAKARIGWKNEKYPRKPFIKILRICLQVTGNYMIQNKSNIKDYLNVDEGLKSLIELLDYSDDRVKIYSLINLHCILKNRTIAANACLDKESIGVILENMKLDKYYLKVLWLVCKDLIGSRKLIDALNGAQKETKILFFQSLNQIIEFEEMSSLPDNVVDYLVLQFTDYAGDIMIRPNIICNGEALFQMINILESLTSQELFDSKIIWRKNDKLVFTSTKLLKYIHDDERPKGAEEKEIINKIRPLLVSLIRTFSFDIPTVLRKAKENSLPLTLLEICARESVNLREDRIPKKDVLHVTVLRNTALATLKNMKKSQQADIIIKGVLKSRPDLSDIKELSCLL